MTKCVCPKCRQAIAPDDWNPLTDLALCRHCEQGFAFSDLLSLADLQHPPSGAWYREGPGTVEIGAALRSLHQVTIGLLFLGVLTIFLIFGACCDEFVSAMSAGTVAWQWLVGMMFWGPVGVGMTHNLVMEFAGHVRVTVGPDSLWVFTGIGGQGKAKKTLLTASDSGRILLADVVGVAEITEIYDEGTRSWIEIAREGAAAYKFGEGLADERRHFIFSALDQVLRGRDAGYGRKIEAGRSADALDPLPQFRCPTCSRCIALGDLQVSTDLAHCRHCARQFRVSELLAVPAVTRPLDGVWYLRGADSVEIGALAAIGVAGQVKVTIGPDRLRVFTEVSGFGRSKEILLQDIMGLSVTEGVIGEAITIKWLTSHYRFGRILRPTRRDFILRALRQTLNERADWPPRTPTAASPMTEAA